MTIRKHRNKSALSTERSYKLLTMLLLTVVILSALPILKNKLNSSPTIALLYWGAVIVAIRFYFTSIHVPGRLSQQSVVKGYAISGAVIYLVAGFMLGVFLKKLKATPYDISPLGLLVNVTTIFSALIAREMIRGYSLGTAWRHCKHKHLAVVLITMIMALTDINFAKISQIKDLEKLVVYLITDVGIVFAKNILTSVFVFYGGSISGILYLGIIEGFQKSFPFLPELSWLANGTIGIGFPIIYAMVVAENCKTDLEERRQEDPKDNMIYMGALFLSVMFAWFCVGVFSIYPSIILTGSMEPMIYPGDVVLIRKMQKEEEIYALEKGDVINFDREGITITHRIEEVISDEAGNRSFKTKGDNNQSADETVVQPNDVNGIVVNVVPKVGMPILAIRSRDAIPEGVIDDGQTGQESNEFGNTERSSEDTRGSEAGSGD
ncbi:MAG: signal peptidase I [Peptostreptococcaceae bacterium]|nr:signal peptidase I [Peptostreptococcaceae bacterium]